MKTLQETEVSQTESYLQGKKIDVIVTGGIAAVETVKIIRELRRWGASTRVIMSEAAQAFVTPLTLEWASSSAVITHLSGVAEQISEADALLVTPATLNTFQK